MPPNPYVPPSAEVADPVIAQSSAPRSVRNACLLIMVALVLGVFTQLPGVRVPGQDEPAVPLFLSLGLFLFFGGLTVWFAIEIFRGKNWARWAMLVYLSLGWILVGVGLNDELARAPLSGIINVICIILEFVACWLLFFGAGARWFSEIIARRRAQASGV